MNRVLQLLAAILVCYAAGALGSFFTVPAVSSWYQDLEKPFFSPPNWVFGPVWAVLYTMMGISLFIVWTKQTKNQKARLGILLFLIQLFLNAAWSIIFFGFRSPLAAFCEIVLLWTFIGLTFSAFQNVSKPAAWLLAPYLLWVSFAAVLNLSIFWLNR